MENTEAKTGAVITPTPTAKVPNLFVAMQVNADPTVNFHTALLALFDSMMNNAGITDPTKLSQLARIRAQIDIALKDF